MDGCMGRRVCMYVYVTGCSGCGCIVCVDGWKGECICVCIMWC